MSPIWDFRCPECGRTDPDFRVPSRLSAVECLDCHAEMERIIGVPQPAIVTSGGTGAGRG